MNCINLEKTTKEIFTSMVNEIGLNEFDVKTEVCNSYTDSNKNVMIYFFKKIVLDYNEVLKIEGSIPYLIEKITDPIFEKMKNSPYVISQLAQYKENISLLESNLDEANNKIKELEKYKDYYDLALKMKNGEKEIS